MATHTTLFGISCRGSNIKTLYLHYCCSLILSSRKQLLKQLKGYTNTTFSIKLYELFFSAVYMYMCMAIHKKKLEMSL